MTTLEACGIDLPLNTLSIACDKITLHEFGDGASLELVMNNETFKNINAITINGITYRKVE